MTIAPTTFIDFPREKNNKTGLRRPLDSHSMGPTNYSRLRCLVFKEQADSIWSPNGPKFVPPIGRTWVLATKVLYHRGRGPSSESRTVLGVPLTTLQERFLAAFTSPAIPPTDGLCGRVAFPYLPEQTT
jgi:hypothetical protein